MTLGFVRSSIVAFALVVLLPACGGPTTSGSGSGGSSRAGGTTGSGGAVISGGNNAAGGTTSTGGVVASGGSPATGGIPASGGATGQGGDSATTASGGSRPAAGGVTGSGGVVGSGGADAGAASTAGKTSTGGATAKGGNVTTGGVNGSGGQTGAGGISATGGGTGAGGSPHTGVWNIMPLGDSITGTTCYPQVTAQQLKAGGHTNFAFIGTVTVNQGCNNAPTVKTEGHAGYGVTYLPQNSTRSPIPCTKQSQGCGSYAELQTWAAEKPDIVLMHFATNDLWDGRPTTEILSAFISVIAEFRKQNPNVIFFVSKVIKLNPSGCTNCLTAAANLAAALTDAWATTNSTATSPVSIIDHYDCGFDPNSASDTSDGVHPTLAGATKMATTTYNALVAKGYF